MLTQYRVSGGRKGWEIEEEETDIGMIQEEIQENIKLFFVYTKKERVCMHHKMCRINNKI